MIIDHMNNIRIIIVHRNITNIRTQIRNLVAYGLNIIFQADNIN